MVRRRSDEETYTSSWRKWVALLAVSTLAWEYFRDLATIASPTLWSLVLQFIYFQLPTRSRAIPYLHSISFIGALCIPVMYSYLLYWKPTLEWEHAELWGLSWQAVLVRSFLLHFAPLLFHIVEMKFHSEMLVEGYRTRPRRIMMSWPIIALIPIFVAIELTFPNTEDTEEMDGISADEFFFTNNILSLVMFVVAYFALYFAIVRRALFCEDFSTITTSDSSLDDALNLQPAAPAQHDHQD